MNDENLKTEVKNKEKRQYTAQEIMLINSLNKIKNPYRILTISDIAKDLDIGINSAYELFKRDDFPSIDVGKTKKVTLLAYILWKMGRK